MSEDGICCQLYTRTFLTFGRALTLIGCLLAGTAIVLPAWQVIHLITYKVVEMSEFNSVHEHGVLYDCTRFETIALKTLNNDQKVGAVENEQHGVDRAANRICSSKMENGAEPATWTMRMAIEEGDPAAREMLLHRFLPHHKAVVFFFVFSLVFALISLAVGACSECFVPNRVLQMLSLLLSACCSILGDTIFFIAAGRENSRHVHGANEVVYEQRVSWTFYLHAVGSGALCAATFCVLIAAYLLLRREFNDKPPYKFPKQSIPSYVCTPLVDVEKLTRPSSCVVVSPSATAFDALSTAASGLASSANAKNTLFPVQPKIILNDYNTNNTPTSWPSGDFGDSVLMLPPPPLACQQLRMKICEGAATTTTINGGG